MEDVGRGIEATQGAGSLQFPPVDTKGRLGAVQLQRLGTGLVESGWLQTYCRQHSQRCWVQRWWKAPDPVHFPRLRAPPQVFGRKRRFCIVP